VQKGHDNKAHKQPLVTIGDQLKEAAAAHVEAAAAIKDAAVALKATAQSLAAGAAEVAETSAEEEKLKSAIKQHIVQSSDELAKLEAAVTTGHPGGAGVASMEPPPPPPLPPSAEAAMPPAAAFTQVKASAPAAAFTQKKAAGLRKKKSLASRKVTF